MNPPAPSRPPAPDNSDVGPNSFLASRLGLIRGVILSLLIVLVVGVGYWQLGHAAEFTAIERRQNQRHVWAPAPRGVIYDREHRVLAGNRLHVSAAINLGALKEEFRREEKALHIRSSTDSKTAAEENRRATSAQARLLVVQRLLDRVVGIVGRPSALDPTKLERHFAGDRTTPFVLLDELTEDECARLSPHLDPLDPVSLIRTHQRWYPNGHVAAHVLGRVRREMIRPPVGEDSPRFNYREMVGDSGIEKQHDASLRGQPGSAVIQIDASGAAVGPPLAGDAAVPGQDLVLSLDLDLQRAAERAMDATPGVPRGAAVAIDVATGEVLVMASKPDFDLNRVSPVLSVAMKQRIDAEGGWLNRASQGLYSPGSSFKFFTAIAALRGGSLRPDDVYQCGGSFESGGHRFVCHNPEGHGAVSLRAALAQSCNVFFYQAGLGAGPDAVATEARRFHLGEPTGVDLPSETQRMLVPDPAWKQGSGRGRWTTGDTINLAIGQGFIRYSPLQAACAIASLARQETLTVPTLLRQPGRRPSGERPPEALGLPEADYKALIDGLQAVIQTGIGRNAQVPGVTVAGKTGTAQVMRREGMQNIAWFVAFAPVERPAIAIAVAMEGDQPGVEFAGGEHAAPIVREILGAYFDKRGKR